MKKLAVVLTLLALVSGSAMAATGGDGTFETVDIELQIQEYCSVVVTGPVQIDVTDPSSGTANADAACTTNANFAYTITPTITAMTGYENPTDNDWTWTPTIDSGASKNVAAATSNADPINVAISGIDLNDTAITSYTKVAELTVTITKT